MQNFHDNVISNTITDGGNDEEPFSKWVDQARRVPKADMTVFAEKYQLQIPEMK